MSRLISLDGDGFSPDPGVEKIVTETTREIIALLADHDLEGLEPGNQGYHSFDWRGYLIASQRRISHIHHRLLAKGLTTGRIIDQGALLGNAALVLQRLGFQVTASDFYGAYGRSIDPWLDLLGKNGVEIADCTSSDGILPFTTGRFDAALSLSVIEHIPHTPRHHLLELRRIVRPDGLLVIETPNLLYQAKREAIRTGKTVFQDLRYQFWCLPPFTGHHREYTPDELRWMLEQINCSGIDVYAYDYSYLSTATPDPVQIHLHQERIARPDEQELLLALGTVPAAQDEARMAGADRTTVSMQAPADSHDLRNALARACILEERLALADSAKLGLTEQLKGLESTRELLQAEVDHRDSLLAQQQQAIGEQGGRIVALSDAIATRDDLLKRLQATVESETDRARALAVEVARRDQLLVQDQKTLATEAAKALSLQSGITERDRLLEHTQSALRTESAKVGSLQDEVAKRDRLLAESATALHAEADRVRLVQEEVAKRDRLLAEGNAALHAEADRLRKIQEEVAKRDALLAELQTGLARQSASLAAAQEQINLRDASLADLQNRLNLQADLTAKAQEEINLRDALLQRLQAAFDELSRRNADRSP